MVTFAGLKGMNKEMGLTEEEKKVIRQYNEKLIHQKGYQLIPNLPLLKIESIRSYVEIKGRLGVMNAIINIAFEAPIDFVKSWIQKQKLTPYLSNSETQLLATDLSELDEEEINAITWYMEGLHALMWLTDMTDQLDEMQYMDERLSTLLPNLAADESNDKLSNLTSFKDQKEVYKCLDYYYLLHTCAVNARLNNENIALDEGTIYERYKALTWALNPSVDWDGVYASIQ